MTGFSLPQVSVCLHTDYRVIFLRHIYGLHHALVHERWGECDGHRSSGGQQVSAIGPFSYSTSDSLFFLVRRVWVVFRCVLAFL